MKQRKMSVLSLMVGMLLLSFLAGSFWTPQWATAEPEESVVGRYQISAWSSYSGGRVHHSGYYVIDTTTGEVKDRGHEIHGIDEGGQTVK
ncbi:MAG: hypothetical protein A2X84_05790 [Desulfuromonadaceae bacterium GWC2_58_13]|nr:MAG: hypothetical protein A2X84_05790 [Desulfuromonadaceae bacterium GWC2_58_13]